MNSLAKIIGLSFAGLVMNSATCFAAPLWTTADYGVTTTVPSATPSHNKTGDVYYSNNVPIIKNLILCLIVVILLMWMGSFGCRVADALERSWIRKQATIKKSGGQRPSTPEHQMEAQVLEQGEEDGISGQHCQSPG